MTQTTVNIGKIIKSFSHIVYICRIYNNNETTSPIDENEYQFGQFVKITSSNGLNFYGIIFNSQLYNPEYGNFGPRLTSPSELNQVFTPDYIDETAVFLSIVVIGWEEDSHLNQDFPPAVIPLNSEVNTITDSEIKKLHVNKANDLTLAYYSTIISNTGSFATPLILKIVKKLKTILNNSYIKELELLEQHIKWQQTNLATRI